MEVKTGSTDRAKLVESAQECVVVNEKVEILKTVNRDVGRDDVHHTVDTHDIILRVKPDPLSRLEQPITWDLIQYLMCFKKGVYWLTPGVAGKTSASPMWMLPVPGYFWPASPRLMSSATAMC